MEIVTVSADGIANGHSLIPNSGADFGPDTPGTQTSGIQEALNAIETNGGVVSCYQGAYSAAAGIAFTGSNQMLQFAAGSSLTFANGLTGLKPNWSSATYSLAYCLILMGAPLTSSSPAPFSHQWFVGNGLVIAWGNGNQGLDGFQIVSPGPQSSPAYTGAGGVDLLIEGVTSSGVIGECFSVHSQYQNSARTALQASRNIVVRNFYDTRGATTGGSGFSVGGNVLGMLIEGVEIDLSATTGDQSNCFIGGWQGETANVVVRRCRFRANGSSGQVLELQGDAKAGLTTGGCHDLFFEDTVFDSGASSGAPTGGSGGGYIDDNNGTGGIGYIYNLIFRSCVWVHCGISFQSSGSTPGYVIFEGPSPGALANTPLSGRSIIQGPVLSASGEAASGLRIALPTSSPVTVATYTPPTTLSGQYRIAAYVAAKTADTPTIKVTWTDPDAGSQTKTILSTALAANAVEYTVVTIVASNAAAIVVTGQAATSATSLVASATIDQVG